MAANPSIVPLPRVLIRPETFEKMRAYINAADMEVSGLGNVDLVDGDFLVKDLFILEQAVSPGSTELDPEQITQFLIGLAMEGRDPSDLKLWWHSHVRMPAFWSDTDENTAVNFGNDWMVSIVGNKFDEFRCRLDIYQPRQMKLDGLELQVIVAHDPKMREAAKRDVERKVHLVDNLHDLPKVGSDFSTWGGQMGHSWDDD